jgi:hypothetical protein
MTRFALRAGLLLGGALLAAQWLGLATPASTPHAPAQEATP